MKASFYALAALFVLILIGGMVLVQDGRAGPAVVTAQAAAAPAAAGPEIQPGNYCVSCHLPEDARLAQASAWIGGIERAQASPCPAVLRIQEELLYTGQLMLATGRLRESLPDRPALEKIDAQIEAGQQGYSRLLDTPVASLSAFLSEAQTLRYRMAKSYAALNGALDDLKKQRILAGAVLVTLVILFSFALGLRITHTAIRAAGNGSMKRSSKGVLAPAALVLIVFAFFALPVFRVPPAVTETASAEEQAVQTALDTAGRAADTADRSIARAWMMARIGAAWDASDADLGGQALSSALEAAREVRLNGASLWGTAQAAQEISAGSGMNQEKSILVAARLQAQVSRTWGLNRIAGEWAPVDPQQAAAVLEEAALAAEQVGGVYHDLDLRLTALGWASSDPQRAAALAGQVRDPALRAWGLREIAGLSGNQKIYQQAAQAARQIVDPLEMARALREIAAASGEESLLAEARAALQAVPEGPALAFELAELAAAAQDVEALQTLSAQYPQAGAAGFYRMGEFQKAWAAAEQIPNLYERGRAQAAIAAAWGDPAAAQAIELTLFRDLALSELAAAKQDPALVEQIASPYYRVQALTALGAYAAAWEAAGALQEPYPLVGLAAAWSGSSPEQALELVEAMDREADKAEALRSIAAATADEAIFQRALGMALAARVRGDSLSPAQASLALALDFIDLNGSWAQAAFAQAYEAAQRISLK